MKEFTGKYGTAKVYTNSIDEESKKQIIELLDSELAKNSQIRIMPDTHAGADNVIGLTMTIKDKIAPSLIGSDIGCGISLVTIRLSEQIKEENKLEKLDRVIKENIPYGFLKRYNAEHIEFDYLKELKMLKDKNVSFNELLSLARGGYGTLGGGNHFIEAYSVPNDDEIMKLSIHTGSRTLGARVYKYYQSKAENKNQEIFKEQKNELIKRLKDEDKSHLIQKEIEKFTFEFKKENDLNGSIKYLENEDFDNYIHDMEIINKYARDNRRYIAKEIATKMGFEQMDIIDKPHNYVEKYNDVIYLRKGSQSAKHNQTILIPINMRDGVILGTAKGNEDWNLSFPHGAGRVLSRSKAKELIDVEEFKNTMKDVYTTTANKDTVDEAPMAYKPLEQILNDVKGELKDYIILKPIYNFKGGSENIPYKRVKNARKLI